MQPSWQIPRPALFWLLATQAVMAVLQAGRLPLWLLGAGALVFGWRILIYRGRGRHPGRWAKTALVVLCAGAIVAEYGQVHGLEPMVTLLWCGFLLKLLEMHQRRDALILVCLGYFVAASHALFDQTPAAALVVLAGAVLTTAVLAALFQRAGGGYWQPLRTAGLLLLEAVPLMLLLFLVMPRLGSLWTVPRTDPQGTLGLSDRLAPGDIGALGASDALAFRVEFDAEPPPRAALYWRALVLSRFDGRRWSRAEWGDPGGVPPRRGGAPPQPWEQKVERLGTPVAYQVIAEPSGRRWLFGLETPVPDHPEVVLDGDLSLSREAPLTSRWSYRARSWPEYRIAVAGLSAFQRQRETALPGTANPRSRAEAVRWRAAAGSDAAYIDQVLAYYHRGHVYSLKAPLLGADAVDEFLWQTKRGFCEHFASSFAFLLRAAGIPARVVVGYQGGEYHPDAGYLMVHQYDAHAWTEAWLQGRGWVRIDPTLAVAPERIELSVTQLLDSRSPLLADSPLAGAGLGNASWRSRLRLQLDYYDYLWAQWVLGYELRQEQLLRGWLGGWDPWRLGLFVLAAGGLALLPALLGQLRLGRKPPRPPIERLFEHFVRRLARRGVMRRTGEGPRSLAARAAREQPALAAQVAVIAEGLEQGLYGSPMPQLGDLRRSIRRL